MVGDSYIISVCIDWSVVIFLMIYKSFLSDYIIKKQSDHASK
jgi:hypothetical protein